jgi:hypothetical protein
MRRRSGADGDAEEGCGDGEERRAGEAFGFEFVDDARYGTAQGRAGEVAAVAADAVGERVVPDELPARDSLLFEQFAQPGATTACGAGFRSGRQRRGPSSGEA